MAAYHQPSILEQRLDMLHLSEFRVLVTLKPPKSWFRSICNAYPHKQDLGRVLPFSFQEEGVQGGLAVPSPPPLCHAVPDAQWVSHVQVLDQLLGSWLVHCL